MAFCRLHLQSMGISMGNTHRLFDPPQFNLFEGRIKYVFYLSVYVM